MPGQADGPPRWRDLRSRVVSAVILAPIVLACVWAGGLAFHLLIVAAATGLALEWIRLCGFVIFSPEGVFQRAPHGLILLAGMVTATAAAVSDAMAVSLGILCLTAILIAALPGALARRVKLALGQPYIGFGIAALVWLRDDPAVGGINIVFILAIVWGSDIGAYMTGRVFGGPRLAPAISPGKTWSGAAGGLMAAILAGLGAAFWSGMAVSVPRVAMIAGGLGIFSQGGDLLESAIKRHFGVKDSSQLIPGHGGLLDRLDALLIVAQVAAVLALVVGRGVVLWR